MTVFVVKFKMYVMYILPWLTINIIKNAYKKHTKFPGTYYENSLDNRAITIKKLVYFTEAYEYFFEYLSNILFHIKKYITVQKFVTYHVSVVLFYCSY